MTDKNRNAFNNWFLSPIRLPLENPYSGDTATAFNAGFEAARDHYAPKLTEEMAIEVMSTAGGKAAHAGKDYIEIEQARIDALKTAGVRFKEEA